MQAFSEKELNVFDFTRVKTFKDALLCICEFNSREYVGIIKTVNRLRVLSKASAAMFMLNIVRKVLNKGYDMHFTKNAKGQNYTWYPCFRFIAKDCTYYNSALKNGALEIGKIISEGVTYDVLGGRSLNSAGAGLNGFDSRYGVGATYAHIGFLGCATEDIANHFGRYFGMLIMEAMYSDMVDFITSK